jgi:hypothetical protein
MPRLVIEPPILAFKRAKAVHALDLAATVICISAGSVPEFAWRDWIKPISITSKSIEVWTVYLLNTDSYGSFRPPGDPGIKLQTTTCHNYWVQFKSVIQLRPVSGAVTVNWDVCFLSTAIFHLTRKQRTVMLSLWLMEPLVLKWKPTFCSSHILGSLHCMLMILNWVAVAHVFNFLVQWWLHHLFASISVIF